MVTTNPNHDDAEGTPAREETLLSQMGGPMGFVYSTVPVVVFATANAFLPLPITIAVSVGISVVLTVVRMLRGERFSSAAGGLVAIGVAVGVVAWTGSAKDFFAIGIWLALAGFVVTFGSVVVRRSLTGVIWNALRGGAHAWYDDRPSRRAHDLATLAVAAIFGARFVVQQWLYAADTTGGLAAARVAMGTPLTILAAVIVVWAFRRSTKRLAQVAGPAANGPLPQ